MILVTPAEAGVQGKLLADLARALSVRQEVDGGRRDVCAGLAERQEALDLMLAR